MMSKLLLYFLFFLSSSQLLSTSFSFSNSTKLCPGHQSRALLHLRKSFSVIDNSSFWGCDYYDLSCSWLYGTIHSNSTLFLFPHLRRLNLAFNDFNGSSVSTRFGRFSSLTHLNLSESLFSGLISPEISHLANLVSLDLSFTLEVYPSLHFHDHDIHLPKLETLDLSICQFLGSIPTSLENLKQITSLNLIGNHFSGKIPNIFNNLRNLISLGLSNNNFSGHFPPSIGNLTNLYELDFSNNQLEGLHGPIPSSIFKLVNLRYLYLSSNNLSESLDLSNNKISGVWSWNMGNDTLWYLNLSYNSIRPLPTPPNSTFFFSVSHNKLSGEISSLICRASSMEILDLSDNNLSGRLPHCLGNFIPRSLIICRKLEVLDLGNNKINDTFPHWLGTLSKLQVLVLRSNSFHGEIPKSIGNLNSLRGLNLSHNNLGGHIPSPLGNLKSLESLDLSSNKLIGRIPQELTSLTFLEKSSSLGPSNWHAGKKFQLCPSHAPLFYFLPMENPHHHFSHPTSPSQLLLGRMMSKRLLLYFLFFLSSSQLLSSSFSFSNSTKLCPHQQALALLHLKQSFSIDNSSSWDCISISSVFPDSLLNRENNSLMELYLSSKNFSGELPASIGNLKNLISLHLHGNNFSGYNLFNGIIPSWLYALPSLVVLYLDHNKLTGHIGEFQSDSLELICLKMNKLHGPIPIWSWNMGKNTLQYLNLSYNSISGGEISSLICKASSMRIFDLSNNNLSPVPRSLIICRKLEVLDLGNNKINDTFPHWLGTLPELQVLVLRSNSFHGEIPKSIGNLNSLRGLNLSHNNLAGHIPSSFGNLKLLESLDLSSNKLIGRIPQELTSLTFLEVLNLSQNHLTGFIPQGNQSGAQTIYVSHNKLSGEISSLICKVSSMGILDLSNNNLSGMLPHCLGNFSKDLSVLNLRRNRFHGIIPQTFLKDNAIRNLDFNDNQLEGSVPRSLIICRKLEVLDLGNNKINDTFPHWLGTLPELQVLVLRSNSFHGEIPKSIGNLNSLRGLNLSHNNLAGHIPSSFGNLKLLESLDLSSNKLIGIIPQELTSLTFLESSPNCTHTPLLSNTILIQEIDYDGLNEIKFQDNNKNK
ncbi:unnamed protein product, partial [Vitis vinifera]